MKNEMMSKKTEGYNMPDLEVILFDHEDVITTSGNGQPVNYNSNDDDKWDTPKINGSN